MRQGRLDLHGRPRSVTWTRLSQTARANGTSLALQQSVDWVPGDRLVLAPTGKNGNETEVRGRSARGSDDGSGQRVVMDVVVGVVGK